MTAEPRALVAVIRLSQRRAGCLDRGCEYRFREAPEGWYILHHYAGVEPYVPFVFAQMNPELAIGRLVEKWEWAHGRIDRYAAAYAARMARTGMERCDLCAVGERREGSE